jgi:hypothetical protein
MCWNSWHPRPLFFSEKKIIRKKMKLKSKLDPGSRESLAIPKQNLLSVSNSLSVGKSKSRAGSIEDLHRLGKKQAGHSSKLELNLTKQPSKLNLFTRKNSDKKLISRETSLKSTHSSSESNSQSSSTSSNADDDLIHEEQSFLLDDMLQMPFIASRIASKMPSMERLDFSNNGFADSFSHTEAMIKLEKYQKKMTSRLRRKMALKLTVSQIDLLGATTGEFRGPGDAYRRFLLGGVQVPRKQTAPPLPLFVVGPASFSSQRRSVISSLRDKGNENTIKQDSKDKRQILDELRI